MALHRRRSRLTQHDHNPRQCLRHAGCERADKQEMAAADGRFDRLALAQNPALALKLSLAASPCTRPLMASSLKKSKVGQGRWRRAEGIRSSPQATRWR